MELRDTLSLPIQHGSPPLQGHQPASPPHSLHSSLSAQMLHPQPVWDFERHLPGPLHAPLYPLPLEQQHEQALQARLQEQQLKLQQLRAEQEAWAAAARAVLMQSASGRQAERQAALSSSSLGCDPLPQHSTGSSSGQPRLAGSAPLPSTPTHSSLPLAATPPAHAARALFEPEGQLVAAQQTQQAQQAAKLAALQRVIGRLQAEIVDLEDAEKQRLAVQQRQAQLAAQLAKQQEWEHKRRQWEEEQARLAAHHAGHPVGPPPTLAAPAAAAGPVPGAAAGPLHVFREQQAAAALAAQPWADFQAPGMHAPSAMHAPMHQQPPHLAEAQGQAGEEEQLLRDQRARLQHAWLQLQGGPPALAPGALSAASPPSPGVSSTPFGSCPARLSCPWPQQPGFPLQAEPLRQRGASAAGDEGGRDLPPALLSAPTLALPLADQPGRSMSLDLQGAPSFEMPDLLGMARALSPGVGAPVPGPPAAALPLGAPAGEGVGRGAAAGGAGLEFRPAPAAVQLSASAPQGWWGPLASQGEAQA